MIFFGRRKKILKSGRTLVVICPNCNAQRSLNYTIKSKYIHVYWIPLFPYGKEKLTHCGNCESRMKFKDLPESIKHKLHLQTTDVKAPFWQYIGLIIIAVLVCGAFYLSHIHDNKQANYIKNPKIGDVYTIKEENSYYSTMKIKQITEDSLYFNVNKRLITKSYKIHSIDKPEYYDVINTTSWSKKDILNMISKKEITNIKRNE